MPMQSLTLLANMPPPSYRVDMPTDSKAWHEVAGPIFLAVAFFFAMIWLARFRTVRTGCGRAVILACIGFAATSYTAWWIWTNREAMPPSRSVAAHLAVEMPFYFFCFGLLFSLLMQFREHTVESESSKPPHYLRRWTKTLLAILIAIGLLTTLILAPGRPDVWPALLAGFSAVALVIWFIVIAAVWCRAHCGEGAK